MCTEAIIIDVRKPLCRINLILIDRLLADGLCRVYIFKLFSIAHRFFLSPVPARLASSADGRWMSTPFFRIGEIDEFSALLLFNHLQTLQRLFECIYVRCLRQFSNRFCCCYCSPFVVS